MVLFIFLAFGAVSGRTSSGQILAHQGGSLALWLSTETSSPFRTLDPGNLIRVNEWRSHLLAVKGCSLTVPSVWRFLQSQKEERGQAWREGFTQGRMIAAFRRQHMGCLGDSTPGQAKPVDCFMFHLFAGELPRTACCLDNKSSM